MSELLKEVVVEPGRLQSPSSILTYRQCPRKYYYKYIERLPTPRSIHLVRGTIAHKVLEDVYDIDTANIPEAGFLFTLRVILQEMFKREWEQNKEELAALRLRDAELTDYYNETRVMVNNFFHYIVDKIQQQQGAGAPTVKEAFARIRPAREVELHSKYHNVRGYADAIHKEGDRVVILDYKTSKKCEISEEYRLQLGIYSMIYEEQERLPDEVGILFLKHGQELRIPVTRELVETARFECNAIQLNTRTKEIADYPKRPGPLCKWSTGQCEFYDTCWNTTLGMFDKSAVVQIGKKSA
jgi:putative RecB family exonuclease